MPAKRILPGPTRPHGRFPLRKLIRLTRDVDRGKVLRPLAMAFARKGPILVTKRQQLHTTHVTNLQRMPYIRVAISRRAERILTLIRGLRQRSVGYFRITSNVGQLVASYRLARYRITAQLNCSRSTITGGLHLLHLTPRRQRVLLTTNLARHRTHTLLQLSATTTHQLTLTHVTRKGLAITRDRHLIRSVLTNGIHHHPTGPIIQRIQIFFGAIGRTLSVVHQNNVPTRDDQQRSKSCVRCIIHVPGATNVGADWGETMIC